MNVHCIDNSTATPGKSVHVKKSTTPSDGGRTQQSKPTDTKKRNVTGENKTDGVLKIESKSDKRIRKKEIRRKSREKKKLSLGRLLTGVKK